MFFPDFTSNFLYGDTKTKRPATFTMRDMPPTYIHSMNRQKASKLIFFFISIFKCVNHWMFCCCLSSKKWECAMKCADILNQVKARLQILSECGSL